MAPNTPFITVITSYYNDKAFLSDAISSVLASTYTNFEYILVDHASTDGSAAVAHSFTDPRIKHISLTKNYGASGNVLLQKALEVAQGEYIKLLCADDILLPQGLEKLVQKATQENADLVFGDVRFVSENKAPMGHTWFLDRYPAHLPTEEYLRHFIKGTSVFPYPGNLIKTSNLKGLPIDYVSVQLADMGLWATLLLNGAKLSFVDDSVADYRVHEAQMCNASNLDVIFLRNKFEHFLFCNHFFNAKPSLELLQKIFPQSSLIKQLTNEDKDLFPFAITYTIYHMKDLRPEYRLAARLKLAELLNNYPLQQRIEQKFNFTLANLREDIVKKPIFSFSIDYELTDQQDNSIKGKLKKCLRKIICGGLLCGLNFKRRKENPNYPAANRKDAV